MNWGTLVSTIVGGLFVLIGSYLGAVSTSKKNAIQRDIDIKILILRDLMGNRVGISDVLPDQNIYRLNFMYAFNQIPVVFNKNKTVIEKFNDFSYHASTKDKTTEIANEKLYELLRAIHEDLDLEMPSKDTFFRTLN